MTLDSTRAIDQDWTEYTFLRTFTSPAGNKVRYKAVMTATPLVYAAHVPPHAPNTTPPGD